MAKELKLTHIPSQLSGKRTPEKVKAALATLKPGRRVTNAQIAAWCARAGRWPLTAEKLAEVVLRGPK